MKSDFLFEGIQPILGDITNGSNELENHNFNALLHKLNLTYENQIHLSKVIKSKLIFDE